MTANDLDRTCGLTDDEMAERFKEPIRIYNEIRMIKGLPIAKSKPKKINRILNIFCMENKVKIFLCC